MGDIGTNEIVKISEHPELLEKEHEIKMMSLQSRLKTLHHDLEDLDIKRKNLELGIAILEKEMEIHKNSILS